MGDRSPILALRWPLPRDSSMVEPGSNCTVHMPVAMDPNTIRNEGRRHPNSHWRWCYCSVQPVVVREIMGADKSTAGWTAFALLKAMDLPQPFFVNA